MSRGNVVALALVATLAVGGLAYLFVPKVKQEADIVITATGWTLDMWNAIEATLPQLSLTSRAIILAHAAYESGMGTAKAAVRGHNVFNLTAGSAWQGAKWTDVGGDTEYNAQGQLVGRITQVWRAYPTLEAAVADYWSFLGPYANRGRYVAARAALEAGEVVRFVDELHAAGYFTLPTAKYLAGLKATAAKLGPLGDAILDRS